MPITRTIYTQGKVTLKTGAIGGTLSNFAVVSGVQNATFSLDTPRENVSSFGYKGLVDKVQVAPETATVSFSYILPKNDIVDGGGVPVDGYGATVNHLSPSKISGLMGDALSDTHSGVHVELAGLGCLISGIMSSFSINASAGDLATVDMTFEGVPSGGSIGQDTDAELPAKNSSISTATYEVLTPDRISGYLPDNSLGSDGGESDPDPTQTLYYSDFSSTVDGFTSADGANTVLTASQTANSSNGWLRIASNVIARAERALTGGINTHNYIISFRVFQNTGATIYVNSGLDAAGGETDLTAGTAVALADGVETTVSFARTFATNDVLTLKFSANADGTGNVTSSGSTAIYIKNVTVSTDGGPNNAGNFAGCVQTATFSWEVPIERIQCLGETVSSSTNYSNPPGTSSLTLEGIDIPYPVSGLTLGDMRIMLRNAKVVSREHNLAVGDVAATFNLSLEATAMDALMFPTLTSN
jgi:hypothetical protein